MNIRLQIASTILKLLCHKNTLLSSTTPMKREICWNLITINWSRMCIWKIIKQIVQSAIIWHFMDLSDSPWSRKVYKSIDKILINISGRTHFIHTCAVLTEKADSNDRGVLYVFIYLCIYCILAASPFIFPFWFDLSAHSDYRSIYLFSICSFHLSVFLFVISHWTGLTKCSLSLNSSEQKPAPFVMVGIAKIRARAHTFFLRQKHASLSSMITNLLVAWEMFWTNIYAIK